MKIAVLVSGGVDSSVALELLRRQGYDVTAFYVKIWLEDELAHLGMCPWEEDLSYVRQVCDLAHVPLEVVSLQKEYWDRVIDYVLNEARVGRTPNPDILCNQQIKFGTFYGKIASSFDKVATGHYARVIEDESFYTLWTSPDPVKDQTYFLSRLNQAQLSRALYPVGIYRKAEVRALAQQFLLPNRDRKDSQGICFLGQISFRDFLRHHLGERPGDFIEKATGRVIGTHRGYWFYTIGQRNGLGLSGGPWFVIEKDVLANKIYLAHGYAPESVLTDTFFVDDLHWISGVAPAEEVLRFKIRHGPAFHEGSWQAAGSKSALIRLKDRAHGVASGQFAVFYRGEECLGAGVIR